MKGYVEVDRQDLLNAYVGFGVRYDMAKELMTEAIDKYYDKFYLGGSSFHRWWHRKKSKRGYVISQFPAYGDWTCVLHKVLTKDELDELHWFQWSHESDAKPVQDLYKAGGERVIIDEQMASFVNRYVKYLMECK